MVFLIVGMVFYHDPFLYNCLRPFIIIVYLRSQRQFFYLALLNVKDIFILMVLMLLFILFFAFFGRLLFASTLEGNTELSSFGDSTYQFFVGLTSENYPDMMLPAYLKSTWTVLYFVFFTIVACFFLQSVLLAVIFDNYKRRVEQSSQRKVSKRLQYIEQYYDLFADEDKDYLEMK